MIRLVSSLLIVSGVVWLLLFGITKRKRSASPHYAGQIAISVVLAIFLIILSSAFFF